MATEGKNRGDDSSAHGWNLFKWKWLAEPPEGLTAAVLWSSVSHISFHCNQRVYCSLALLAPIWTGASPVPSSAGTDSGAELRGRLLIIGALLTTPFLIWRLIVGHWAARASQDQARVGQEQVRIAQETARNTLFAKAIEQLGASESFGPSEGRYSSLNNGYWAQDPSTAPIRASNANKYSGQPG